MILCLSRQPMVINETDSYSFVSKAGWNDGIHCLTLEMG